MHKRSQKSSIFIFFSRFLQIYGDLWGVHEILLAENVPRKISYTVPNWGVSLRPPSGYRTPLKSAETQYYHFSEEIFYNASQYTYLRQHVVSAMRIIGTNPTLHLLWNIPRAYMYHWHDLRGRWRIFTSQSLVGATANVRWHLFKIRTIRRAVLWKKLYRCVWWVSWYSNVQPQNCGAETSLHPDS